VGEDILAEGLHDWGRQALGLNPTLAYITGYSRIQTVPEREHFTITKINWLLPFKEVIAVSNKTHKKPINTKCRVTDCYSRRNKCLP
jgi:hypothetical protein